MSDLGDMLRNVQPITLDDIDRAAERLGAKKWETVYAEVVDHRDDEDASNFERNCTSFRATVHTLDGRRYGVRALVATRRLVDFPDLYGHTLDVLVRDVEAALARDGQIAS